MKILDSWTSNVTVPVPYRGTSFQVDRQSVQLDLEAMQAVS